MPRSPQSRLTLSRHTFIYLLRQASTVLPRCGAEGYLELVFLLPLPLSGRVPVLPTAPSLMQVAEEQTQGLHYARQAFSPLPHILAWPCTS